MRIHPPWAGAVTFLQISQMFVGVAICVAVWVFHNQRGLACDISPSNYLAGLVMYGSYFLLFMLFALDRYVITGAPTKGGKGAVAGKPTSGTATAVASTTSPNGLPSNLSFHGKLPAGGLPRPAVSPSELSTASSTSTGGSSSGGSANGHAHANGNGHAAGANGGDAPALVAPTGPRNRRGGAK